MIARRPDLRAIVLWGGIALGALAGLLAVEPVFVREVLGGGPGRLGVIYSLAGVGATTGALAVGALRVARRELVAAAASVAFMGGGVIWYAVIARWPAVAPAQVVIGAGFSAYATLGGALIQRRSETEVVGRVVAAQRGMEEALSFGGTLAAGAVAVAIGVRPTLIGAGGVILGAGVAMGLRGLALERRHRDTEESTALVEGAPDARPPMILEALE